MSVARVVHGARVSLKVGFVAVGIATVLGLLVGLLFGLLRRVGETRS